MSLKESIFTVEKTIYCFLLNSAMDWCENNHIFKEQTICAKYNQKIHVTVIFFDRKWSYCSLGKWPVHICRNTELLFAEEIVNEM